MSRPRVQLVRHELGPLEVVVVGLNRLNRWVIGLAVLTVTSIGGALLASPSAAAATNLVNNGGFETGNTSGWACPSAANVVTSPVRSGSYALNVTPTNSDDGQCTQTVAVQPNSAYTLTAWVIGSYVYLGDTGTGTTDTSIWTPGATSYSQLSVTFTTGASTTSVGIYLHGWYAQPTYYADDVTLTGPGGSVPVPAAPTGLSVTGTTSSSASLSWSAVSGTVTGYNVYRNGTKVGTTTSTSYTDTGLAASTAYSYAVTAYNSAGESAKSATVQATTSAGGTSIPGTPTGLAVTGTTSSSASLSWSAVSGTVTGYNVYRNGTKVGTTSSTSDTDSGLSASTTYSYAVTAYNSAGESAKSATVQATTASSGGGGGSLPAHILTGYWQDFTNGAQALRLSAVPTTYDLVAVAFANADPTTPGAVTFSVDSGLSSALGGYSNANFVSDIATLHSRGQHVIISVGGANGTISVGDSTSATNFANSVNSLISQYGFDGVDIDLENGVNATYMSQALHSIASAHPGVIITLAPQTIDMQSTGMAYFQLALNIKSILTVVNMQYYNSGTMNGCDGNVYAESTENFMTALACIQVQGGLSPSQIGLGLPASTSAAGGGYVSPSTVNSAMDCLDLGTNCGSFKPSTTYTGLRGAMTWSINWDASNGYAFANTVHPHLSALH